jgi:hypothetical protein
MKKEIQELFDNINIFASLIAKVNISNLSFEIYNFSKHAMMVDLILTPKNQFNNLKEAFSAIFKKELFESEEWNVDDEPSLLDEKWIMALKNIWIKEYFLTFSGVCLEVISPEIFIRRFQSDLRAVNTPETIINGLLIKFSNLEVIQIQKGHVYSKVFGQSDSHYFLFEYGIYD